MLDLDKLPTGKHEGLCKILDYVLVALFAAFFILSLFPFCQVQEGQMLTSRGVSYEAQEDDSWSLLAYCGFPSAHSSVGDWQKAAYKDEVAGISTKTVSIKQVGAILFLDVFALIGIAILLLKKGLGRAIFGDLWGIIGIACFLQNYLLNMGTNWVRPVMLAIVAIVLVVSVADTIFYGIDSRAKGKYLRSVSASYA